MSSHANPHAASTGQSFTSGAWLDVHFEANRPEYELQLRMTGIQTGWHVLDAASGSGSFLPVLAELVGPDGRLAALDLAAEHVTRIQDRLAHSPLVCPVEARVGTVLDLPYADDTFDAVWFANTSQYLTDEDLATSLAEFRRVVRPGGLVAVKEADGTMLRLLPAPVSVMQRLVQGSVESGLVQAAGVLRAPHLPSWLRRAGLVDVSRRTTLIERSAPLDPAVRAYWHGFLVSMAAAAPQFALSADDHAFWTQFCDLAVLEAYLDDPDFCGCDVNILTVGVVPVGH
jgi:SAM-dependent methyltransferase